MVKCRIYKNKMEDLYPLSSDSDDSSSHLNNDCQSNLKKYCSNENFNLSSNAECNLSEDWPKIKQRRIESKDSFGKLSQNTYDLSSDDSNEACQSTFKKYCSNQDFNIASTKIDKINIERKESKESLGEVYELSDDSDLEENPSLESLKPFSSSSSENLNAGSSDEVLQRLLAKYKKPEDIVTSPVKTTSKAEDKKQEREANRLRKRQEKEKLEKEKAWKKVVGSSLKPEECMKSITVKIDGDLLQEECCNCLVDKLQENDLNFEIQSQLIPNTITWSRKVNSVEDMEINKTVVDENYFILLMNLDEFLKLMQAKTLVHHLQGLFSIIHNLKHLTLIVYNLENYYKHLKREQKEQFKAEVSGIQTQSKTGREFRNLPKIPRDSIECALVELQLCLPIYFRTPGTSEEVATVVLECSKAVGQIPYKQKKQEKYEQEREFFDGVNKDCVQVDKNGNGLNRLWNQVLTMFPLARLETAEAITAKYPTPALLVKAYENCQTRSEGEKLLQDLPIRRAAGPLVSVKRIGPELSKKLYNFFCSDVLL